jgi:hypothetical protein
MNVRTLISPILYLLMLLSTACVGHGLFQVTDPPIDARVDSLSSTTAASKRTYVILPGNPDVQPLDLQFQEFKLQAERVLQYRGFSAAPDPETADLIIFLAYGLGTPSVSYDYLSPPPPPPTEAPSPPPAAPATQPLAQPIAYSEPPAPAAPPPATTHQPPAASSAAQGSSSALPPLRNIRYLRYLSLSAIDLAYFNATGELAEVWRTNVSSIGKSDDLRRIVPVMLAAATKRIATGTNGRIEVRVTERHPKARYIRGEITEVELRRLEAPYGP